MVQGDRAGQTADGDHHQPDLCLQRTGSSCGDRHHPWGRAFHGRARSNPAEQGAQGLRSSPLARSAGGSSLVDGVDIVTGEEADASVDLPLPPVGVGAVQDLDDVPAEEGQLGAVMGREVELGLNKFGSPPLEESRGQGLVGAEVTLSTSPSPSGFPSPLPDGEAKPPHVTTRLGRAEHRDGCPGVPCPRGRLAPLAFPGPS